MIEWFRWWHGTVTDPKFQLVARRAKTTNANVLAVWACMLEHASHVTQCDAKKQRGDIKLFQCDVHDVLLGLDDGVCHAIYQEFCALGMIADNKISAWENRQPKREDSSAERTRAYRDRLREEKKAQKNKTCDAHVTQCDDRVTVDKDKDKDINKSSTNVEDSQSLDSDSRATAENGTKINGHKAEYEVIRKLFNEKIPVAPSVHILSPTRKESIRRIAQNPKYHLSTPEDWSRLFDYITQSDFLMGRKAGKHGQSFRISFDWILKPANLVKILEGNYTNGR